MTRTYKKNADINKEQAFIIQGERENRNSKLVYAAQGELGTDFDTYLEKKGFTKAYQNPIIWLYLWDLILYDYKTAIINLFIIRYIKTWRDMVRLKTIKKEYICNPRERSYIAIFEDSQI